jgi:(p)ppGpp synthase/HD superfamily hydrolase
MTTKNRETFFAPLQHILAPSDYLRVEVAYALAKHAHRAQVRKELDSNGNPIRYFEHLRDTALNLREIGVYDPDLIIAALMHDSLEDTELIHDRMLEHLFGSRVCRTVKFVTKGEDVEEYYNRLQTFGTWEALMIKSVDRLSNLRTLDGCSAEFQWRQIVGTKQKIYPLMDFLIKKVPSEHKDAASRLCQLVIAETNAAVARLARPV